jgi:hypothetical protein
MWLFNNKQKTVLAFIKEVELDKSGRRTIYYTRKDGRFVSNSLSSSLAEAENFFDDLVKLQGVSEVKTILKQVTI